MYKHKKRKTSSIFPMSRSSLNKNLNLNFNLNLTLDSIKVESASSFFYDPSQYYNKEFLSKFSPSQQFLLYLYTLRRVLNLYFLSCKHTILSIDPEDLTKKRGEKLLLLNILINAVKMTINIKDSSCNTSSFIQYKTEATTWLFEPAFDSTSFFNFISICSLLDLDSSKIRRLIIKILEVQKSIEIKNIEDVIKKLNSEFKF